MMEEREGKIFIKSIRESGGIVGAIVSQDRYFENLLALEIELNGPIATELYKKYGISIRVHL